MGAIKPSDSARLEHDALVRELIGCASLGASKRAKKPVNVQLVQLADKDILRQMLELDKVFREELRYDRETYEAGLNSPDATLLLATPVDGSEPIAFAIRYWDDYLEKYDPGGFRKTYFADEMAVRKDMQGRGIGPVLMNLSYVLGSQLGYPRLALFCEATNDDGKDLPAYYTKLGFEQYAAEDVEDGIPMRIELDERTLRRAIDFLKSE